MSTHLSISLLSALADNELPSDQLSAASEHLATCAQCTSNALSLSLLKTATARAGQRYAPQPHMRERIASLISQENSRIDKSASQVRLPRFALLGWAAAVVLLLISAGALIVQKRVEQSRIASAQRAALVTEAFDQHIAALATGLSPQVISTDRHTVKPWFQGKIPFSFNLPENLPLGVTLDGANLSYLHNQPTAQLLYSLGKHRASVFVEQSSGAARSGEFQTAHSGFHVIGFNVNGLEITAVSDADPSRLAELSGAIRRAQDQNPSH